MMDGQAKDHHWGWSAALVASLFAGALTLLYAGHKIDYEWHWARIPDFFITHTQETVISPINGQVTMLEKQSVQLKTMTGEIQTLPVPNTESLKVGQEIFEGDTLASAAVWRTGPLLKGLWVTLWMSLVAGIMGFLFSIVIAFMRLSKNPLSHGLSTAYIEIVRGTPLLVQLLIAYFFVGSLFNLDKHIAGLGALAFFAAAYFSEILRGGILSIPHGQLEAARALGLSQFQSIRYLMLPMGIKRSLPALTGQMINLVKDSSLLSVIAVYDLTKAGREVASSTFASFEVWFTVALLYLIITFGLGKLSRTLEKRSC